MTRTSLRPCSTSGAKASLVRLAGSPIALDHEDPFVWPVKGTSRVAVVATARTAHAGQERRERDRLLYVAMTRARDRLYVAGFEGKNGRQDGCWYDLVWTGLQPALTEAIGAGGGKIWRCVRAQSEAPDKRTRDALVERNAAAVLPDWALRAAPRDADKGPAISPSRLARYEPPAGPLRRHGARAASGAEPELASSPDDPALLRGSLTHLLLQHLPALPRQDWATAAEALLARRGTGLAPDIRARIATETLEVLRHGDYAALFGPESRAEVPIVAAIPHPAEPGRRVLRVSGQVDRLALIERDIVIVDYKTNHPAPRALAEVPEAYVVQLAAYRLALQHAFPGHVVRAALLWTDGARIMEIPAAHLDRVASGLWERAAASP
jgi:ATP-dependent helicase/nuclease subunit A